MAGLFEIRVEGTDGASGYFKSSGDRDGDINMVRGALMVAFAELDKILEEVEKGAGLNVEPEMRNMAARGTMEAVAEDVIRVYMENREAIRAGLVNCSPEEFVTKLVNEANGEGKEE